MAAVPVGGGGAWPGFESTRQACAASVEGAGGTGWHGRASRRGAERSEALASRAAGPSGARNTSGATQQHQRRHIQPTRAAFGHNKTARPQWGRAAVAVALGFEPRVAVTPHSISSAAPSAARTRYLTQILYYTLPPRTQIDRASWEQDHTAVWEQGHTATRPHAAHTAPKTGTASTCRSIDNEIK